MVVINTLGPKTTDSYRAVEFLIHHQPQFADAKVNLHPSFEDIYHHLDLYPNQLFLVPTAYQSKHSSDNWSNNHYRLWKQLTVIDTFHLQTIPMILVENQNQANHQAVLHAATKELMDQFQRASKQKLNLNYVTSKPFAQQAFNTGNYQYAIFSETDLVDHDWAKIIQTYRIEMVWCLYRIQPANQ